MARTRKTHAPGPVRTCVGCRRRAAKSELLRVVAGVGPDGLPAVVPDPSATAAGRGAHLHPTAECHELALRRRAFPRALRVQGALSSVVLGDYLAAHPTLTADVVIRQETGAGSS